jgi:hypothetical protein
MQDHKIRSEDYEIKLHNNKLPWPKPERIMPVFFDRIDMLECYFSKSHHVTQGKVIS